MCISSGYQDQHGFDLYLSGQQKKARDWICMGLIYYYQIEKERREWKMMSLSHQEKAKGSAQKPEQAPGNPYCMCWKQTGELLPFESFRVRVWCHRTPGMSSLWGSAFGDTRTIWHLLPQDELVTTAVRRRFQNPTRKEHFRSSWRRCCWKRYSRNSQREGWLKAWPEPEAEQ